MAVAGLAWLLVTAAPALAFGEILSTAAENRAAIIRIADDARYLSSPKLEGRGLGTKGIDRAVDHIVQRLSTLGLRMDLCGGGPFQVLPGPKRTQLGPDNRLSLVHLADTHPEPKTAIELKLDEDYSPLSVSSPAKLDAPLVFVGYGITAAAEGFDEYAHVDVRGKAVIVLRHEPQQDDPKSVLNGTENSPHAFFRRKLTNAQQHGAAAVIFCTDQFDLDQHLSDLKRKWQVVAESLATQQDRLGHLSGEAAERARRQVAQLSLESQHLTTSLRQPDALLSFDTALGDVSPCGFPVFHCRRSAIDKLLRQSLGSDLSQLERRLDAEFRPQSTELPGWRVRGQADLQRRPTTIRNVVAALEPRKSDDLYASTETIVVGAHYDHLGYGGVGSLATGDRRVHPGADDNASGVAVLLEVAHRLVTAGPLPRRVLFIAFGGEESGLLGSMYYVKHPPVPLDSTVAMINFDMVGRMTDQRVMVLGCGSCAAFRPLLDAANAERGLQLVTMPLGVTPSDQLPFIGQQIPSLHLFTGMHGDYHRPGDEFGKLNVEGMRQIALLAADVITGLANLSKVPQFTVAAVADARGHQRAFLGGIPAEGSDGTGCRLMSVVPGGPAYRAGVQPGDVIVQLDNRPVTKLEDLLAALQHCREGQRVNLTVRRGPRLLTLEVTLSAGP